MQLESYRSTSGPLEFRLSVFSTLVSTRHLRKSADSIRAQARSGMALRRQHPRKGPCRRVQSSRRTSCTSHGTHQGRAKHQDSCSRQCSLASYRHCPVQWERSRHFWPRLPWHPAHPSPHKDGLQTRLTGSQSEIATKSVAKVVGVALVSSLAVVRSCGSEKAAVLFDFSNA